MPRNASRGSHGPAVCTLTSAVSAAEADLLATLLRLWLELWRIQRVLADRIESKRKTISLVRVRAACSTPRPFFSFSPTHLSRNYLVRPHHLVVLVLEHVAVAHIPPGLPFKPNQNSRHGHRVHANGVSPASLARCRLHRGRSQNDLLGELIDRTKSLSNSAAAFPLRAWPSACRSGASASSNPAAFGNRRASVPVLGPPNSRLLWAFSAVWSAT